MSFRRWFRFFDHFPSDVRRSIGRAKAGRRPRQPNLGVERLEAREVPAVSWVNPAGGSWQTPGNWNTGAVPGPADEVRVEQAGTYVVSLAGSTQAGALRLGGATGFQTLHAGPAGVVSPQETLTIHGAYTQAATGVLNLDLGAAGSDQLIVDGTAALAGTLNLSRPAGFNPALGTTFEVVRAGAVTGAFTAIVGLDLGSGRALIPSYTATGLKLTVGNRPTPNELIDASLGQLSGGLQQILGPQLADRLSALPVPLAATGPLASAGPTDGVTTRGLIPAELIHANRFFFQDVNNAVRDLLAKASLHLPGQGLFYTEGDHILRADELRDLIHQRRPDLRGGEGIRIGVISDGVLGLERAIQLGDLPNVEVNPNHARFDSSIGSFRGAEGTAMLEIIHDIAPGADLLFSSISAPTAAAAATWDKVDAFNDAVDWLIQRGADIIVDDYGSYQEPFFEVGRIGHHLQQLANNNFGTLRQTDAAGNDLGLPPKPLLFVTAAGNDGEFHYQAAWNPAPGTNQQQFSTGPNDPVTQVLPFSAFRTDRPIVLQWNDQFNTGPFNPLVHDFRLDLIDLRTGAVLRSSQPLNRNIPVMGGFVQQRLAGAVLDLVIPRTGDYGLAIVRLDSAPITRPIQLEMFGLGGMRLGAYNTPLDALFGHGAIDEVLTVGAVAANDPLDLLHDQPRPYSSNGPATFNIPGMGDVPVEALDVMGIDGVSISGSGSGIYTFSGTSAAAPHVAAVAALLKSLYPNLAPGQLRDVIQDTSFDINLAGYDRRTGHGRVDTMAAYQNLAGRYGEPALFSQPAGPPVAANSRPSGTNVLTALGLEVEQAPTQSQVDAIIAGTAAASDTFLQTRLRLNDQSDFASYAARQDLDLQGLGLLGGVTPKGGLDLQFSPDLDLHFGLDGAGVYLDAASRFAGRIVGTVNGTAAFGPVGVTLSGSVQASPSMTFGQAGQKLRAADMSNLLDQFSLSIGAVQGELDAALDLDIPGGVTLHAAGGATLTGVQQANGSFSFTWSDIALSGSLSLPGLTEDGSNDPASFNLTGTIGEDSWSLTGAGTPGTAYRLNGFRVEDLTFTVSGSAAGVSVAVGGRIIAELGGGASPVAVPFSGTITPDGFTLHGGASFQSLTLGAAPGLQRIENGTVTADFSANYTTGAVTGGVAVTAGRVVFLPDRGPNGVATATNLTGSVDSSGNLSLGAGSLQVVLGDLLTITGGAFTVSVGPNATGDLFFIDSATATLPGLSTAQGAVQVAIDDLRLERDGDLRLANAHINLPAGYTKQLGAAEFLPFEVTDVDIAFPVPSDVNQFALTVAGQFDIDTLEQQFGFRPTIIVGSQSSANGSFTATLDVASLRNGTVALGEFGPITLGLTGLNVGAVTLGGELRLGGIEGGDFVPDVGGSLRVVGGLEDVDGSDAADGISIDGAEFALTGTFRPAATNNGVTALDVAVDGDIDVRFRLADVLEVRGFGFQFSLGVTNPAGGFHPALTAAINGLNVGSAEIDLGDFLTLRAAGVDLNFSRTPGQPIASFDEVSADFHGLDGWGGTLENLVIGPDGLPQLAGLGFSLQIPPQFQFDFDWLPVRVDELGLRFHDDLFAPGGVGVNDPTAFSILFSGGLVSSDVFPISASFEGVELDVAKLAAGEFPVRNLEGVSIGVEPFELAGGLTIGGGLSFGTVHIDHDANPATAAKPVLYGRIHGEFAVEGIGAGVDLVVSEYGPVLATATAPLGIPIAQTGIVLSSVSGGLLFGRTLPTVTDPKQLNAADFNNPIQPITKPAIAAAITPAVQREYTTGTPQYTWGQAFTLALSGNFIHVAAPGMVSGDLTLAANVGLQGASTGLKLMGVGDLNLLGVPLASAKVLFDFHDPIAPVLAGSFRMPNPGNPLGFLLPGNVDFGLLLDTQGLALGAALGTRVFVERLAAGTLEVGQALFNDVLEVIAQRLAAAPERPLAQLLFGVDHAAITVASLTDRLLAAVPADLNQLSSSMETASRIVREFVAELFDAAQEVIDGAATGTYNLAGATAGFSQSITSLLGSGGEALLAFSRVVQQAMLDAAAQAADVFNPSLIVTGAMQPVLFGIPFGPPESELSLRLNKTGLELGAQFSFNTLAAKLALLTMPGGSLLALAPLPLPFRDVIDADISLPFGNAFADLVRGQLPQIDPVNGDWSVVLNGGIEVLGYEVAQIGGLAFPANWSLLDAHVQKVYENPSAPLDRSKVQVSDRAYYDNLRRYGGLLLNGGLYLPSLLADPGQVFASLPAPPADPTQMPDWLGQVFGGLGSTREMARVQMFLPSFASVLRTNFDSFTGETSGANPRVGFATGTTARQVNDIINAAYFEGIWDSKILGIQLASARVRADANSVQVRGAIPWLGNLQASFGLASRPESVRVNGVLQTVDFQTISAEASLTLDNLKSTLAAWGLSPQFFTPILPTGGARFRAYSPAYDPSAADPLLRTGGLQLTANLGIPGLVQNAAFSLTLTPPADGGLIPDFTATAKAVNLNLFGSVGGLRVHSADLTIQRLNGAITIRVNGSGTLFGQAVTVSGTLNPDLTGSLQITVNAADGKIGLIDGFAVAGSFRVDLTRTLGGTLQGSVAFTGTVTLPGWLTTATGKATATANGTIATNGSLSLSLSLTKFQFGSGAAAVQLVGSNGPSATFGLTRTAGTSGVLEVSIDGQLQFAAAAGLPTMSVSGKLSSTGTGSLAIGVNKINLGGFAVNGTLTLNVQPGMVEIGLANGLVSIPGLASNVKIAGQLSTLGLGTLTVDASQGAFNLGDFSISGAFALKRELPAGATTPVTSFRATNASLNWNGVSAFTVPLLSADSQGNIDAQITGKEFALASGTPLALKVNIPSAMLYARPGQGIFQFQMAAGSLTVPLVSSPVTLPAININLNNDDFTKVLGTVNLGFSNLVTLQGKLTLRRTAGVFALDVDGTTASAPARLSVSGLAGIDLANFTVRADGTFDVDALVSRIGPAGTLAIVNADIHAHLEKTGSGATENRQFRLAINGGQLELPVGNPITLPDLSINTAATFDKTITVPSGFAFGSLATTSNATFRARLANGVFDLQLTNQPSIYVLGSTLTIQSLRVASDGTYTGSIAGALTANGVTLASTTFSVSRVNSVLRLSGGASANFGFASGTFNGYVQSNGSYSFNATGNASLTAAGVSLGTGSYNLSLTNTNGLTGTVTGSLTLGGLTLGSTTFNVTRASGVTKLSGGSSLNFGFANASFSGWVKSDGNYDLSADGSASLAAGGVSFGTASYDLRLTDQSGLTGTVVGSLTLGNFQIASTTYTVTRTSGVTKLSGGANIDVGFVTTRFDGWVKSNGTFSFTGSTTVTIGLAGVDVGSGTVSMTVNNSGFSGRISASVNIPFYGPLQIVDAAISTNGTFSFAGFSFDVL